MSVVCALAIVALSRAQATDNPVQLPGVLVTGERAANAQRDNADPIVTITREALERSGATTVGQLLEQLPQVTGDALTPQANNGGNGNGASTISLRGLGDARTLILLDGRRIVSRDVNILPLSMIDQVVVLTEGAGTVYGSDAIGGVVNFITRKHFTGAEIIASGGAASDLGDAQKLGASLTYGAGGAERHWVLGFNYDRSGSIHAADRAVGAAPYVIDSGEVSQIGSSRTPTGRFFIDPDLTNPATGEPWGCGSVTRIEGTEGRTAADFRCRRGSDLYNYQTENFLYTPSNHIQFFVLGNNQFSEGLHGYASLLFNRTGGHNRLAPEAFDTTTFSDADGNPLRPVLSQYSQYNPFGQDIPAFTLRTVATGDRSLQASENLVQGTLGLTARFLNRFDWDNSISYGRQDSRHTAYGFLNIANLAQQIGPSNGGICYETAATNPDGTVSYSNPIAGCTPINFTGTYGTDYNALRYSAQGDTSLTQLLSLQSSLSGELFALPLLRAPPISATTGFEFRRSSLDSQPDPAAQVFQLSENNSAATKGSYNVEELYTEFLIPLARNRPLLYALNLDLGVRGSNYSNFGSTVNAHYAIEYHPIKSLLLRATYADLFRAPAIEDLDASRVTGAPLYNDICNGYGGAGTSLYPHLPDACRGVPNDFQQPDVQTPVQFGGNPDLKPETGYSTDFGLVYSPEWFRPLTLTFDAWRYRLRGAINTFDLDTALRACAVSGDPVFCGDGGPRSPYYRDASGAIVGGLQAPGNVGTLFTDGFDFGVQLKFPRTRFGSFRFDLNGSYLNTYQQSANDSRGAPVLQESLAGLTTASFTGGGFPRLKFSATLDWRYRNWDLVLTNRFIASVSDNGGPDGLGNVNGLDVSGAGYIGNVAEFESFGVFNTGRCNERGQSYTAVDADGAALFDYVCRRNPGYADYQDVQLTYSAKALHTDFTVGVNDIFDQGAPITYTSGQAFNYDASNYEVTGRFVYARIRLRFGGP